MLRRLRRTEGLDGLLHLYKRLEKRGRACCYAWYVPRLDG
jgi:hypothetical protein